MIITFLLLSFLENVKAAMTKSCDGTKREELLYDHLANKDNFWFDFMADTGDGGNSSYAVAKLLAQPTLQVSVDGETRPLPRGNVLIIGGDLA